MVDSVGLVSMADAHTYILRQSILIIKCQILIYSKISRDIGSLIIRLSNISNLHKLLLFSFVVCLI